MDFYLQPEPRSLRTQKITHRSAFSLSDRTAGHHGDHGTMACGTASMNCEGGMSPKVQISEAQWDIQKSRS